MVPQNVCAPRSFIFYLVRLLSSLFSEFCLCKYIMATLSSTWMETRSGSVIACTVPAGITISDTPNFGQGICTVSSFKKGEVVYTGEYYVIKHDTQHDGDKDIRLDTNIGQFKISLENHAVKRGLAPDEVWHVYTFDSFINHSCDPNTRMSNIRKTPTGGSFDMIATRDIASGTHLTTDYDMFTYSYPGIPLCQCGASHCKGFSYGYKYLSQDMKQHMLPWVIDDVKDEWTNDKTAISMI
jgi:hypothetical protein